MYWRWTRWRYIDGEGVGMSTYQHWKINKDNKDILWVGFDRHERSVNTINDSVLDELQQIIDDIKVQSLQGVVIHCRKQKGFIAGADISHFSGFEGTDSMVNFLHKGQAVFDALESLTIPTVAVIDGFCMGGGTELVLACDYRIASDSDSTIIGLPEVLLGIHPGWGGTVRLPKLIGGFNALSQVILPGSGLRAKRAKKLGVIDDVVAQRQLHRAAEYFILNKPSKQKPGFFARLTDLKYSRLLLAKLIRSNVAKRVNPNHYPAPFAVIDNWVKESPYSATAQRVEADSIGSLITRNDTTKNLVRAYFLRERMKSFSKEMTFRVKHVHVVGAGTMGGDIAAWCALKGMTVTLEDRDFDHIAPAIKRAHKLYKKKLKKTRLVQQTLDRLIPDVMGQGARKADVIIEAIYENLEAKQAVFKRLEEIAPADAILATNTSSIPLVEISETMSSPSRLVGIHFFNPVARMELVEVVKGEKTDKEVLTKAYAFVGQISRLTLPVKSSPGFLVNRVLMPYLMECVALLEEGVQAELIDKAAKNFGMFMGPVELADTVGLDVCLAVAENLTAHFGGEVPEKLKLYVKAGRLGKKSGQGLYSYDKKGKPIRQKLTSNAWQTIANRLILRMVNEAATCLREGVVEDSDLLDAGMIFGTGFAPFRGGPMQYAQSFGDGKLNELFKQLEREFGERFKADAKLTRS
jgi:3-hydroxyacyl-CoA dehydrogenase / enoyl-CoA hydratase / 3-hydroxybutyryl-CoA epimerase